MSESQMKGHLLLLACFHHLWARMEAEANLGHSCLRALLYLNPQLYSYYLHLGWDLLPQATWNCKSFFISGCPRAWWRPFSFIWTQLGWRESSSSAQHAPFAVHLHLSSAKTRKQDWDNPLFRGCCYTTFQYCCQEKMTKSATSLSPQCR